MDKSNATIEDDIMIAERSLVLDIREGMRMLGLVNIESIKLGSRVGDPVVNTAGQREAFGFQRGRVLGMASVNVWL